jgi:acetyltransferase
VLSFRDEGHLIQAAAAFATQPIPRGNRIGIITNTGGPAVIATDVLVGAGCTLPPLSEKTRALLKEKLYPGPRSATRWMCWPPGRRSTIGLP